MCRKNPCRAHRLGLTLLELVVVMTILIALAGILVALFPGFLRLAHTSTGATNLSDLNRVFHTYHQVSRGWPNGLDNLTDGTDLYARLPGDPSSATYYLEPHNLSEEEARALRNAGITHVFNLASDNTGDATFHCYGSPEDGIPFVPVVPDNGHNVQEPLTVARLRNASDIDRFQGDRDGVYVVFGVGQAAPLVGPGGMMQDPPLHFGHTAGTKPNEVYSRFAAVFRIGREGMVPDPDDLDNEIEGVIADGTATFITCVGLHGNGIRVPADPIRGFHHTRHSQ